MTPSNILKNIASAMIVMSLILLEELNALHASIALVQNASKECLSTVDARRRFSLGREKVLLQIKMTQ